MYVVARANLKVSYDADSGFWGTSIKKRHAMTLSEYDRVLVVLDSESTVFSRLRIRCC